MFPNSAPDSLTPKYSNFVRSAHVTSRATGLLEVEVEEGLVEAVTVSELGWPVNQWKLQSREYE